MDTKKLRRLASQIIALCDEEDYKNHGDLFAAVEAVAAEPQPAPVPEAPEAVEETVIPSVEAEIQDERQPKFRHVGLKMQENGMVRLSQRIGKKEGFCRRESIEKTISRTTGATAEQVREAVNEAVQQMRLTCFFWSKYRFYRTIDRQHLIAAASDRLSKTA